MSRSRRAGDPIRCDLCGYWIPNHPETAAYGRCQRFPPVPMPDRSSQFPATFKDFWCGEWVEKPGVDWQEVVEQRVQETRAFERAGQ